MPSGLHTLRLVLIVCTCAYGCQVCSCLCHCLWVSTVTRLLCALWQTIVTKWNTNGDPNVFALDFRIPGLDLELQGCLGHPNWY